LISAGQSFRFSTTAHAVVLPLTYIHADKVRVGQLLSVFVAKRRMANILVMLQKVATKPNQGLKFL
jgi:hypothetical protein